MAAPRNENIKTVILDETEKLLRRQTISDISLAQIAEASGISKGTLYYYYKNKNDILFDITDRDLDRQWEELIAWTENKEKDTSIHRLVRYVIERDVEASGMRFHLMDAALLGDEVMRQKLVKRYREFQVLISEKIAERTDKVSADYITWLILTASDGIVVQQTLRNEAFDMDSFIEQSTQLFRLLEDK